MYEVILRLLVLQFLVAAVLWIGSAPLPRFEWSRGPAWMQMELTRWVLPLLMVVAGLLFFSNALVEVWAGALHLRGLGGVPDWGGRAAFFLLNLAVISAVVSATGGVPRSPFVSLPPALLLAAWAVGVPWLEVAAGLALLGLLLFALRQGGGEAVGARSRDRAGAHPDRAEDAGRRWSARLTLASSLLLIFAALRMGGHLGS